MRQVARLLLSVWLGLFSLQELSARVIVEEDFEAYADTEALRKVWGEKGLAELDPTVRNSGKCAIHPGGAINSRGGFAIQPTAIENVVLTADIYDFATNANKRMTVGLRGDSVPVFEMGIYNLSGCYFVRLVGFAGGPEWRAFDKKHKPLRGWHRFQAVIGLTNTTITLDLGADGTVDETLSFDGPASASPFNNLRFGGPSGQMSVGGGALFDNIKLELVPTVAAATPSPQPDITESRPEEPPAEAVKTVTPVKSAVEPSAAEESPDPAPASAPVTTDPDEPPVGIHFGWWIGGGFVLVALLLLLLRRKQPAPTSVVSTVVSRQMAPVESPPVSSRDAVCWRERAFAAEQHAAETEAVIRAGIIPQLTQFLKQKLVLALLGQRRQLLEIQHRAELDIAALEARLARINAPLQERLNAYEKRIADLEKELETRGEENRELIKATIDLAKQKLAEEKSRHRVNWN